MTILMGDLNAKIGSDNSGYEEAMGRQGLGKMNENGEMLADFCAFNNMIIGGSVFPHRRIHKATWVSPDHRTENQIDHICIGRKFRRSMQDVKIQRGADAASDHHLVLARMKMKLKKREVKRTDRPIKDKNGNVLTSDEDQLKRWRKHFEELLNRPPHQNPPDITPAEEVLQINCERPSKAEIEKAIRHMKRGKTSGPDKIPAEAIKADIETSTEILHDLFGKIWEQEEIPTEWKEGYLVKLPKKGDMQDCMNYRGIMLLSVPGTVFNRVILDTLKTGVDAKLRDHQAGFRQDRSCTDQIATLRIIVEQSMEWDSSLYINFCRLREGI